MGILATCLVFPIADVFFNVLPDDTSAVVIALFIGSRPHPLIRHLLDREPGKFGESLPTNEWLQVLQVQSLWVTGK